ncbi:MAG: hypothetical protein ACLUO4_00915 [Christensenellales bacterium]
MIVRLTTRISPTGALWNGQKKPRPNQEYKKQPAKYIMMPGYARGRKVDLIARMKSGAIQRRYGPQPRGKRR